MQPLVTAPSLRPGVVQQLTYVSESFDGGTCTVCDCTVKRICTMGLRMILTAGDCGGKVRTSSRVDGAGRLKGFGGGTTFDFLRRIT